MWLATTLGRGDARSPTEPESFAADMPDSPIDRSFGSPTILTCDGERHRELRRSIDPKYRPHAVEGYIDELVEPIVAGGSAALEGRGEAELMAEFFEPVSVLSLGAVLGLADVDADTLRRWFAALADGGDQLRARPGQAGALATPPCAEIEERLGPLLDRLEREPDESTISHMIWSGAEDGRPRARERYLPSLKVILLGGMQEPGHGAGSVLYALLAHPQQLAEVACRPRPAAAGRDRRGHALDLADRDPGRRTTTEVELGGASCRPMSPVAAVISSANRDPARFADPDRFDIAPRPRPAGDLRLRPPLLQRARLRRAQERIALRALLERYAGSSSPPSRRSPAGSSAPPVSFGSGWGKGVR